MSVHCALHLLEEGARCALFRHQGRNLVSTEAAHVLGEVAREVLRSMDSDLRATRAAGGSGTGWFKIGARYSLTIQLVPQLIGKGPANTRGPALAQSRRYAVAVGGSQMCGSSWSMSRALWVGSRVSTSFRYA